jgi:hypothetical protein
LLPFFVFILKKLIYFSKPIVIILNFFINYSEALRGVEFLTISLDIFIVVFMMSYVGIRRELVRMFQFEKDFDIQIKIEKIKDIIIFLISKSVKITFLHLLFLIFIYKSQFKPKALGDDYDSALYYLFRNIFYLLIFNNYKDALELQPIMNNKKIVISNYFLDKLDMICNFNLPNRSFIDQVLKAKRNNDQRKLKALLDKVSFLKENTLKEIEQVSLQEHEKLILSQGNVFYFTSLFKYLIFDFILSVLNALIFLWKLNFIDINIVVPLFKLVINIGEFCIQPYFFGKILKLKVLIGQESVGILKSKNII